MLKVSIAIALSQLLLVEGAGVLSTMAIATITASSYLRELGQNHAWIVFDWVTSRLGVVGLLIANQLKPSPETGGSLPTEAIEKANDAAATMEQQAEKLQQDLNQLP